MNQEHLHNFGVNASDNKNPNNKSEPVPDVVSVMSMYESKKSSTYHTTGSNSELFASKEPHQELSISRRQGDIEVSPSQEMADARDYLKKNPAVVAKLAKVFAELDPKSYPFMPEENGRVEHLRNIVKDLYDKPNEVAIVGKNGDVTYEKFEMDEPFYVIDLARLIVQMARFRKHLPRVHPFYAVKCNPTPEILKVLSAMGCSFDCASIAEISAVLDDGLGNAEEDCLFANPCKIGHHMKGAAKLGVRMTTFDNLFELEKIQKFMPNARAILRIATDDKDAQCELSSKFGARMSEVTQLLTRAKELEIDIAGVSFHVGSGNTNPNAFVESIQNARQIFDEATNMGFSPDILDIGGGFPGCQPERGNLTPAFESTCALINPYFDALFPPESGVRIIAEPGRFFAESVYALALNVHARRILEPKNSFDEREYQYYISDGVYGSFNCILFDHQRPKIHLLVEDAEAAIRTTTIFGPTCDGLDCIMKKEKFPELDVGEWIFVSDFGAYTVAARTAFNGYVTARKEIVSSIDLQVLQ